MEIKILHIVSGDSNGGAARGAYWLHKSLVQLGIQSNMLISGKLHGYDSSVTSIQKDKVNHFFSILRSHFDSLLLKIYKKRKREIFSTGLIGFNFINSIEYKNADVIHLHWINGGFINIKDLNKIKKPIVWTLRDMWPFTGGCHYSLNCERFNQGCGSCPILNSRFSSDLSTFVFKRKLKYFPKSLIVVGISNWLTRLASNSPVFKNNYCTTIFNNINIEEFQQISKCQARKILGISTNKKIILCGSIDLNDSYKGFHKYLEALSFLNENDLILVFFGSIDPTILKSLKFEVKVFGYLNDNISLNLVYSSADVFVAPSIQEAFGKTLAEAQCSGTPVVCFDATGPQDIVDHMITGYKALAYNSEDFANGINWVLNVPNYEEVCNAARKKIIDNFDSNVIALKYIQLYKNLIKIDL